MTAPRRRWGFSVLKLLFTGLLLAGIARALNLRASAAALAAIDPIDVAPVLALFGTGVFLSCVRWRLALAQLMDRPPGLPTLVRLYMIGCFVNLGLPMMAGGDVVRAELLRERVGRRNLAYASILTDRLIGVLAVVGVAVAAVPAAGPLIDGPTRVLVGTAALVVGSALAVLALMLRASVEFRWLPARMVSLLEPMRTLARRPGILAASLTIAVVVQAFGVVLPTALLARAMGINVPLSVHFALVPIVILASLVPLGPNGLGVRETGFVLLYGQVGVPAEQAFALGLSWSLVLISFGLAGGVAMIGTVRPARARLP